ncbi:MAG: branched-chain amino acid ABC transporter permease [Candidatus Accumulibacter sp.]|nr:branched-chain amino acid ABC transporter permease [Accumulibacter sp.]
MSLLLQFFINGCMLGMMYALVAVGFTLFFGVLDVIVFSHGDSVMVGAFAGLSFYLLCMYLSPGMPVWLVTLFVSFAGMAFVAGFGMLVSRFVIMPLRSAPALNTLLATMMLGTVMREAVRLFFPDGSNPKPFPRLLPDWSWKFGGALLRFDNIALFIAGGLLIVGVALLINHTRLGMAIRAVAQDAEAAQIMGVDFPFIVLLTFAIGSAVAAFAGLMNGLYYNEINFNLGLLLGVIGFSSAVIGGLGNIYGAILGGFVFAFLQVFGTVAMPFSSAYKDVFAFGVVIVLMAIFPTGILSERQSQRV